MFSDATAAIGIVRRRGMGRIRHLDVLDPWIHRNKNSQATTVDKVIGADCTADLLTNSKDRTVLGKSAQQYGYDMYGWAARLCSSRYGSLIADASSQEECRNIAPNNECLS